jgi:integrase/recombinase XerC
MSLGMSPAQARRQELPKLAPRALDAEELRRFLKAIMQSDSLRNRAVATIMLNCGLRISEVAALNVSDVALSARKRELTVRCGKNSKRRTVPINKDCSEVLQHYLQSAKLIDPNSPLFVSRKGFRLSQPAIDHLVRQFGKDAGVEVSSHRLRHTCLTRLVRAGIDIVAVAEIAGHSRLETTRRYSLPTEAVMIAAMEKLNQAS